MTGKQSVLLLTCSFSLIWASPENKRLRIDDSKLSSNTEMVAWAQDEFQSARSLINM
jgi:hypothetical protein